VRAVPRTWQYLRLLNLSWAPRLEPPMGHYAPLCAAVSSAARQSPGQPLLDAQSALLDTLCVDGWELVANSGSEVADEWLIFKRELPGPN